jgi:type II secretory pathway component GspD/PulD (secretin)
MSSSPSLDKPVTAISRVAIIKGVPSGKQAGVVLHALKKKSTVHLMAAPKVVTTSGNPARIEVGNGGQEF